MVLKDHTVKMLQRRRKVLMEVYVREGAQCFYCDIPVSLEARRYLRTDVSVARKMNAATLDHIIPRSHGGRDGADNCVCACYGCNEDRRDRPAVDFLYERRAAQ